jgi:Sulfatase.
MNYDKKLMELLDKYHINVITDEKLNENFECIIIDALTKKCKNRTCAIWGAGQNNTKSSHAAILITKYATYIQNMCCVIDSNSELQGKTFLGYPIISPEQIEQYGIDLVLIASKNSGKSIKKSLFDVKPNCNYVDIYEELREKGIEVYQNFYDENSIYIQIYEKKERYNYYKNETDLFDLISLYFSIRDLYYAEKYIKEYINLKYNQYERFQFLLEELSILLHEMKEKTVNRTEDISLFYIDALRAKEVFDLENSQGKIFKQYIECGKLFTNMYSTAVTTYESMMSVITGKYPLETEVYVDDFLHDIKECELLQEYNEKNYELNLMVSDCYRIIKDTNKINFYIQIYMAQKMWTVACRIAESERPTFNLVYFPYETHFPLLCGFHSEKPVIKAFSDLGINEFPESIDRQYKECVEYTDKQFKFYYELLGSKTTKVIFSDHAQVVYDKQNNNKTYNMYYKYKELTTHIPLIVSKEGWNAERIDSFYSMIDFNQIIKALLSKLEVSNFKKDIVRYQYYPMHNPKMREHANEFHFTNYIDGMDIFMSRTFIYIQTATGVKEVYSLDNLQKNICDTDDGQRFINDVKQQYKMTF